MTILTTPAEVVLAPSTPADITTELNNTLVSVAAAGGGTVSLKPATYTALGKIWLLPYVHLDLKGSTINGAGVGSGILFETATLVGGVPTSNVGTPDGSRLVLGIPDHLICLLRNLYAGQEATVRTGHGTTDW